MKIIIRYFIDKTRLNSSGLSVIKCRLTYLKKRKEFSTGHFINPSLWDSKSQLVKPPNEENDIVNIQLSLIRNKINQAFLMLQIQQNSFDVYDIYSTYKGEKLAREYGTIEYFEVYLNKLKRLIGIDIKQVTWNKSK